MCLRSTTVEEGGETVFPNAQTKVTGPEWSECAKNGLAVKTRKGDALLFFRYTTLDLVCLVVPVLYIFLIEPDLQGKLEISPHCTSQRRCTSLSGV